MDSFGHRELFAKVRFCENVDQAARSYAENRLCQKIGGRHEDFCDAPSHGQLPLPFLH